MAGIDFRILGPVEVVHDGRPVEVGAAKERALLALLLLDIDRVVSLDRLVHELWEGRPPDSALASVRVHVSRLRKSLAAAGLDDLVVTRAPGYQLRARQDTLDANRFEAMATRARGLLASGDGQGASEVLTDALALWRGPALADVADLACFRAEAGRLEEARLSALEDRVEADLVAGRHTALVAELEALTDEHPFRERLWGQRMLALHRSGRPAEAMRAYHQVEQRLADELGLTPGPALRRLEAAISTGAADLPGTPPTPTPHAGAVGGADAVDEVDEAGAASAVALFPATFEHVRDAPFVGREDDLETLRACWARACAERSEMVLVAGDTGVGKTRLAAAFADEVHRDGATVLLGRCDEEALAPYQPFVESLRQYLAASSADRLQAQLGHGAPELVRLMPELAGRLPPGRAERADAPAERYRLFDTVAALLNAASRARPVLLIIDDLHWADRPTLLLVRHLLRAAEGPGLLILGAYRPTELAPDDPLLELVADLRRERPFERVLLRGLDEKDVGRLVAVLTGHEPPPDFAHALHRDTGGNPLFICEVIAHLADAALPLGSDAAGALVVSADVPEGIREVIGRRVARLSEPARTLVTNAAVAGREFELSLVERVTDLTGDEVLDALDEATAAGLVCEVAGHVGRYSFTHAVIRETVYRDLSTVRRVRLHRRMRDALEVIARADGDRFLPELAYHALEAVPRGDEARATVDYAVRAAERATSLLAYEDAARLYELALQALDVIDADDPSTDRQRARVLLGLGGAQGRAGLKRASQQSFRRAAESARAAHDTEALGRAALGYGGGLEIHDVRGAPDQTLLALLEEALASLDTGDSALRSRLLGRLAVARYWDRESADRRTRLAEEAVEMAQRTGDRSAIAAALSSLRYALWSPDNLDERLAITDEVLRLATDVGDRERVLQAHRWRIMDLLEQGDVDGVDREIETHARLAWDLHQPLYIAFGHVFEAMRALMCGELGLAEELQADALELATRTGSPVLTSLVASQQFQTLIDRGQLDGIAGAITERARADLAIGVGLHAVERCALALVLSEQGDADGARAEMARIAADGYAEVPRDASWLIALVMLARACANADDRERARELYDLLLPYCGRTVVVGPPPCACWGSTDFAVGLAARTLGDRERAIAHLRAAIAADEHVGTPVLRARTQLELATTLFDAGDDAEALALLDDALAAVDGIGVEGLASRVRAVQAGRCKA